MAKTNVGIDILLNENTSAQAPRVVRNLEQIGEAGQKAGNKLQEAFGQEAQQNYDRFSQKVDELYQSQLRAQSKSGTGGQGSLPAPRGTGRGELSARSFESGSQIASKGIQGVTESLGQGDVVGAGAATSAMLKGPLKKLVGALGGPATAALGGTVALGAGAGLAANAAVNKWQPHIEPSRDLAASLGELSGTVEEQTEAIHSSFSTAAGAAEEFGKSAEHGIALMKSLSKAGVSGGMEQVGDVATETYQYATKYNARAQSLTKAQGMEARFGLDDNILGLAGGGLWGSGMNRGRYEEYLQAMTSTMESGLQRGVIRDPSNIQGGLTRVSSMGAQYKGRSGAQFLQGISGAFAQSTNLQNESDLLKFRAARETLIEEREEEGVENPEDINYKEIEARMEQGVGSGAMMQNLWEQIKGRTGDKTQEIEQLQSAFGLNATKAIDLRKSLIGGNWSKGLDKLSLENFWEGIKGQSDTKKEQLEQLQNALPVSEKQAIGLRKSLAAGNLSKGLDTLEKYGIDFDKLETSGRGPGGTSDEQLLQFQQKIQNDVAEIGQTLTPLKTKAMKAAEAVTSGAAFEGIESLLESVLGTSEEEVEKMEEAVSALDQLSTVDIDTKSPREKATLTTGGWSHSFLSRIGGEDLGGRAMYQHLQEAVDEASVQKAIKRVENRREALQDDPANKELAEDLLRMSIDSLREAINEAEGMDIEISGDTSAENMPNAMSGR